MAAPGPGRQAQPAGGAADRGRHGRGPGLPAVARGRGPAGAAAARRPAPGHERARRPPAPARRPGWRPRRASPAGPIVTEPRRCRRVGRGGHAGDPRPCRDLARRRPRHGPGGGHPHVARRPRQPRRGRRARLGHPGGGRRVGGPGRGGRAWPIGDRVLQAGDDHHHRRRHRRGLRGDACPARARSCPRPRRCSPGPPSSGSPSASAGMRRRRSRRSATRRASPDRCLRAISLKGFAPLEGVADAVLSTPDDVRPVVDQLAIDGLVATTAGAYKLTDAGTTRVASLVADERAAWGESAAAAALDAFLDLDHRIKDTVTAWQLRDDGTRQRPRGRRLRRRACWSGSPRCTPTRWPGSRRSRPAARGSATTASGSTARSTLRAAATAGTWPHPGSTATTAIWFELHEDLIQLAGRTREEESAAGRA